MKYFKVVQIQMKTQKKIIKKKKILRIKLNFYKNILKRNMNKIMINKKIAKI